jgi:hypothetical protein
MLGKALLSASVSAPPAVYVEDVFSTYLYTGTGTTLSIDNGIDLAGEGGLVWLKRRDSAQDHGLFDTTRGATKYIQSNGTDAEITNATSLTNFNSDGFTLGSFFVFNNDPSRTYASWTFRKQAKFFDVVTWTGNGVAGREIAHSLGSVPGCIIAKCTSTGSTLWPVYHVGTDPTSPEDKFLRLNGGNEVDDYTYWNDTAPTDTVFTIDNHPDDINGTGKTYVAYLFAHNAGGFGDAGTDNVISCGSYTGNGADDGPTISLGWEPQWLLIKRSAGGTGEWILVDTMRGMTADGSVAFLEPNTSDAEANNNYVRPTADGFKLTATGSVVNASGSTYIYIAIRRGPMRAPESGTEVFNTITRTGTASLVSVTGVGFSPDLILARARRTTTSPAYSIDKLRGVRKFLQTPFTDAEGSTTTADMMSIDMDGFSLNSANFTDLNSNSFTEAYWNFRRAPGFFDVVAYTGTGSARTVTHNLGVAPEMMIVKSRSDERAWRVYTSFVGNTGSLRLNSDATADSGNTGYWNNTTPTDASFTLGIDNDTNSSGQTYIAYLFATLAGISKVGSYTGTGTTLNVDCGFTAGARFVLIKRTDSTGDWYVWDTARGIVSGDDPYLLLNSNAAEVTGTDYIDPLSSGFQISSTAPAEINASGGTYIFLAIA